MKVKAQCLCKSQQALKGLQRVLSGTETWHTLAFGISSGFTCRVCVFVCSCCESGVEPGQQWETELFALMSNTIFKVFQAWIKQAC